MIGSEHIAEVAVDVPAAVGWSYLYTHCCGLASFIILIIQKCLSINLIVTIVTRLATYITLYDLHT